MKLFENPKKKRTIEELEKQKKTWLILTILWGLILVGITFADAGNPWWTVSIVLFVGSGLRCFIVALAIELKKEIQELKDKIEKSE